MIWIGFLVMLALIMVGAHMKGIGLGVMGMVGVFLFVMVFNMRPSDAPIDVMLIIMAIVTTSATLQAAGGLSYLVGIAEKIIRDHPGRITFIAPFTTYFLCLFAGTSHIVYSLLPIISEVATKRGIRPERPLSIAVIAAHLALTASPISAATAALITILATNPLGNPITVVDVMLIGIPSGIVGILAGSLSVHRKGRELHQDPVFLKKMSDPVFAREIEMMHTTHLGKADKKAKRSVILFAIAILLVVLFSAFPQLLPVFEPGVGNYMVKADGSLTMVAVVSMVTLSTSAVIMLVTGTKAQAVAQTTLFTAMGVAAMCVFGVVWMASTFMLHHKAAIQDGLGHITSSAPWVFSFAVIIMAALIFSQSATTKAMMPLGITLGISNPALLAMFPAVNADFILPGYPTLLAAIQFDRTGSTRIGKWVFDHSFMWPGLVTLATAIMVGFLLVGLLL
ncbi:MAG TPA: anaerobic C4-dicarboxylate transporter [Phnomibacter sp.]|nr:anaerobic C4-dicarboxylate transporter [Phnomibacter sp.]